MSNDNVVPFNRKKKEAHDDVGEWWETVQCGACEGTEFNLPKNGKILCAECGCLADGILWGFLMAKEPE